MIFAVAAIALVACSKEFDTNKSASNGTAIGFNTWAEQLTKAARVPGTSTFTAAGYQDNDFAVYGYKDKTTPAKATVFDDVVVSTTDGSAWTYTTPRFWDNNYDSYTFYAISPAAIGTAADGDESSSDVNPQTGAFVTRAITFAGNDNDILVADKKTVNKTDGGGNFNSFATVPLVFNHVASLVDFKVKKAASLHDATVTISAFELSDIDNVGQLTVSDAYTDSHPVATWSGTARTTYGPEAGVVKVKVDNSGNYEANGTNSIDADHPIIIAEDTAFPGTPAASTMVINNLIVKPQTFRASDGSNPQKITLTYKIAVTGSADVEYANCVLYLCDFDNVDDEDQGGDAPIASWEPGKHYTFFITIDAHKISFSASITPWADVNGYNYLLN